MMVLSNTEDTMSLLSHLLGSVIELLLQEVIYKHSYVLFGVGIGMGKVDIQQTRGMVYTSPHHVVQQLHTAPRVV